MALAKFFARAIFVNEAFRMEGLVFIFVVFIAVFASFSYSASRGQSMLNDWASQNFVRVMEAKFCWLSRGPFFWGTSKNQVVFRIKVADRSGQSYDGWARCGSYWWGLMQNKVEVRWDGASPDDGHWKSMDY